jgi:hypothetical protein
MRFLKILRIHFTPLWSFFDAEMRADLDFFDAENTSPSHISVKA